MTEHDPALDVPATNPDRRWYRRQTRNMLALAVLAVLGTIIGGVVVDSRSANRTNDRDEATKYQRCTSNAEQVIETNASKRAAVDLSERNIRLYDALGILVAQSKTGTEAQRFELREAASAVNRGLDRYTTAKELPVPDCRKLYERGFHVTREIGGVVPTLSTPEETSPDNQ